MGLFVRRNPSCVNRGPTRPFDTKTQQCHQVERGLFQSESQLQAKLTSLQQELASVTKAAERAQVWSILWFLYSNSLFAGILEELRRTSEHNVALSEENFFNCMSRLTVLYHVDIHDFPYSQKSFLECPSCWRTPMTRNLRLWRKDGRPYPSSGVRQSTRFQWQENDSSLGAASTEVKREEVRFRLATPILSFNSWNRESRLCKRSWRVFDRSLTMNRLRKLELRTFFCSLYHLF